MTAFLIDKISDNSVFSKINMDIKMLAPDRNSYRLRFFWLLISVTDFFWNNVGKILQSSVAIKLALWNLVESHRTILLVFC